MTWEQSDETSNPVTDDKQLQHIFKIENSFATELSISGKWKNIKGSFKYLSSKDDAASQAYDDNKANKYLGNIEADFDLFDSSIRYIHTKTSGSSSGYDYETQNTSYIEFDTELTIVDMEFFPKIFNNKVFGLGYRYQDYTLPQSIYIIGKQTLTQRSIETDMNWKSHYITAVLDTSRYVVDDLKAKNGGFDFYGRAVGGYAFNVETTGKIVGEAKAGNYLNGDNGYFYELEAGLIYMHNFDYLTSYLKAGYRYDYAELETSSDSDVYIYAKATSKYYGPFLTLHIIF